MDIEGLESRIKALEEFSALFHSFSQATMQGAEIEQKRFLSLQKEVADLKLQVQVLTEALIDLQKKEN